MRLAAPLFGPDDKVPERLKGVVYEDLQCPYCNAMLEVEASDDLEGCTGLDGETDVECPACEREFTLVFCYMPSYSGIRKEKDA